jgi:uncharacterized membrane protein YebE (DUF533 family)
MDAKKLLDQLLGAGSGGGGGKGGALNDIGGLLGSVLSQSVAGVKEGAADINAKTGVGGKIDEAVKGATGKSAGDLFDQVKDIAGKNKLATGAVLGGLGALLLGTKSGRGVAGGAATLGGLTMVAGLAYKAYKNHQAGKSPMAGALEPPPIDSPFATGDEQEKSLLIIRAMIAAAASDGLIDNAERSRIVGGLEQAGLDTASAKFLDAEFAKPATIAELVAAARTPELKVQAYTAARLAIEPESAAEKAFLEALAAGLGLDAGQVAHIDAAAAGAKAA